ncbi:armadillo-type protein [Cunninghamella echinulata]|nr:armadillo-type protein [Cunninghamella echinulata]
MNIETLLNFEQPLDIGLLDYAVQSFYTGDPSTQKKAQDVLTVFQNRSEAWQAVPTILETSQCIHTKFLALRIMETFIIVRWNTISIDSRLEIRNYIVQLIVNISSKNVKSSEEQLFINKLNVVLVQILKKDWPQNWVNFIPEIIASSQTNISLCENNIKIIKLLSEEIFDYSENQMTISKIRKLKKQMIDESELILNLCLQILSNDSLPPSLIEITLKALCRFITWLSIEHIMGANLIYKLKAWLKMYRNLVIQCYIEIANLDIPTSVYNDQLYSMYQSILNCASQLLPSKIDIAILYNDANTDDQAFVRFLSLFFTSFLSKYTKIAFYNDQQVEYINIHEFLLRISKIDDKEIWKICLEYWEANQIDHTTFNINSEIIDGLRKVILLNMVPPSEVLIVEDDDGEVIKEYNKESETFTLFLSMKNVLCSLTKLDISATLNLLGSRISLLLNTESFSWIEFNKLCWTIGSINNVMDLENENSFLETIMQKLIDMAQKTAHSEVSYVITSCLVYIGCQYPRFLTSHSDLLQFILDQLFNYMQESLDSVRDMACDSFLKICKECKDAIAVQSAFTNLESSLTWSLIHNIDQYVKELNTTQIYSFYQAIGYLISAASSNSQLSLLSDLVQQLNTNYRSTLNNLTTHPNDLSILKSILTIISINDSLCITINTLYNYQFYGIIDCLIETYRYTSMAIHSKENIANPVEYKFVIKLKTEIHKLTRHYITGNNKVQIKNAIQLNELIQIIMDDYRTLGTESDPAVIELTVSTLEHFGMIWPDFLNSVLQYIFEPTLGLIKRNFTDYPDHRLGFYHLLSIINKRYFTELIKLPESQLSVIVDSLLWGSKHNSSDISHIALQTCEELINQVSQIEDEDISSEFFQKYYLRIFTDILTILVDPDCQNGLQYQSQILARLLELVKEGEIYTQVFDVNQVPDPLMSNTVFLQTYVKDFFNQSFPLLLKDQIDLLVLGMFEYSDDISRFKTDLQDFLVDIREVGDEDTEQKRQKEIQNAELELLKYI